jgi:Tol biopolymer transport system component
MWQHIGHRFGFVLALAVGASAVPRTAEAQYFGRNKVQYEQFEFQVLQTEHFDLHYYPEATVAARDAARMAERWYTRLAGVFSHEILSRQPLVLYADHADFQQTNVVDGTIDESTGGVTEGLQRRVVMPMTAAYRETDHVLGHELVHAFQYDIASRNGGIGAMNGLPLWSIEGMAEYLSIGRRDPHTAMWLRDAVLHDDVPTLRKLSSDMRYFPYRFGEAVWAYIGGRWGDARIADLYTAALRKGWERAVRDVLGVTADSLSKEWVAAVAEAYRPLLVGRVPADSFGRQLDAGRAGPGELMVGPAASPDGRYVAFLWAREFSIDLYIADARTGAIVKQLVNGATDTHFDALSFMGSAGAWSPDGRKFATIVFARGNQELAILDITSGDIERKIPVPGVSAIATPAWSPDGRTIAFSGTAGGLSDLYVIDLATGGARRLTDDRYADLQPSWSPDGRSIAFATDRGGAAGAIDRLEYGSMRIALVDVASGAVRVLSLLPAARHINPQYSPDGRDLFFLADPDGFRDLYRVRLDSGELFRISRLATGISGLTALSPALSVASRTGAVVFSAFHRRGYIVSVLDNAATGGEPVHGAAVAGTDGEREQRSDSTHADAGTLPPFGAVSRVNEYLADAVSGMPDTTHFVERGYTPKPRLSYFGLPTLGLGIDRFGVGVYADLQAYFTDVLGDHGLFLNGIANGSWKDLGGQAFYESKGGRLNWGVGGAHIPYVYRYPTVQPATVVVDGRPTNGVAVTEDRLRLLYDQALGSARYPLSATRRVEASGGVLRISYDYERVRTLEVGNRVVSRETTQLSAPAGYTLWQGGVALVGDYSTFGIASPVQGGRYRFELQPSTGSFTFVTALADWRRYLYQRPVTLAARALHYGRYGSGADRPELGTLFVGAQGLVRGYDYNSFTSADCTASSSGFTGCAQLDRLLGSRLAVGNLELRVPLIGNDRYGLIDFSFLPTELALFVDGGVAWTGDEGFSLGGGDAARKPVFSAGASARFNLFGAFVLETYYALPFQRTTGGRFGLQLIPGW